MEAEIQHILIAQVGEHLKTLPAKQRVRELIYNHFTDQCNQYNVTEDDFYKHILKPAFKEAAPAPEEDPDPENRKGTFVKIFGTTIHSLKRLGEVLFEDPAREKIYFEDVTFLKAHVDTLEHADAAIEYVQLYKSEKDAEKRYLKICYLLNHQLPYRIQEKLFANLEDLLSAGFKSWLLMNAIYQEYNSGKLHIWLHAQDAERFPPAPDGKTLLSFLAFLYSINPQYPFFIEEELFYSPLELVTRAQNDLVFWDILLTNCTNGNLYVWFDALGYTNWRTSFKKVLASSKQNLQITEDEKVYHLIQQLLYIIDPGLIRPQISVSESNIELLNLAASQLVELPITISLKTPGFVKASIGLENDYNGIRLNTEHVTLFDLTNQKQVLIKLSIDPQQLIKNSVYSTSIQIVTDYETLKIHLAVQAVFPLRAYFLYMLKYALFGGFLFALLRWMISSGSGQSTGLSPFIITQQVERSLPDTWPVFFWVLLAMLGSLIGSYFMIRKVEKI